MINRLAVKDTWPLQIFILGVVGENNALTIEFDVTQWAAGYENCTFAVIYLRPDGQLYPVEIAVDGETVKFYESGPAAGFSGLTVGATYFLSDTAPGEVTTTAPTASGHIAQVVGVAVSAIELQVSIGPSPIVRA